MSAGSVKAGSGYLELFLKSDSLMRGLKTVEAKLQSFSTATAAIGAGFVASGAAIATPLLMMARNAADTGDAIRDMSLRTGVSTEALSQLGYAAEQSGTDMGTVEKSISKMQRTIAGPGASKALNSIGLSMDQIQGLSPDQQFEAIADAISKIQDPAQRTAALMTIFGKSGTQLAPMFENGAQGIRDMRKEADSLGRTIDGEAADASDGFNDALNALLSTFKSMQFAIGAALLPALTDVMAVATEIIKPIVAFVQQNKHLAVIALQVAAGLAAVGVVFGVVSAAGFVLAGVASGIIGLFGVIGTAIAFVLSPMGLFIAAVAAATFAFVSFTSTGQSLVDNLTTGFTSLLSRVQQVWQGISDALAAGNFALAGQIVMAGLETAILTGLAAISEMIGGVFGDVFGTIASKVLKGDLLGAWNTVVLTMTSTFASFVNGIVGMFASMASSIINTWSSAVEAIANKILDMASQGGVFGKAFEAITGVNMAEEKARAERMNAEARRRGLGQTDFAATTRSAVADNTNAMFQGVRDAIDGAANVAQSAADSASAALEADTEGGASALSQQAAESQARLDELLAQAAAEREAAAVKAEQQAAATQLAAPGLLSPAAMTSLGTFSGAAAAGIGLAAPSNDVQERMADSLEHLEELQQENNDLIADSGAEFGP